MEPADDRHPLGARVPHLVRHRVRPEDDERARPRGDVDVLRGREQRRVARREVGEEGAAAAHAAASLEDAQVASVALPPPLVEVQDERPLSRQPADVHRVDVPLVEAAGRVEGVLELGVSLGERGAAELLERALQSSHELEEGRTAASLGRDRRRLWQQLEPLHGAPVCRGGAAGRFTQQVDVVDQRVDEIAREEGRDRHKRPLPQLGERPLREQRRRGRAQAERDRDSQAKQ
mmetsp:Transcript_35856/g.114828  ORF Transcript_35856/g.114828 Transcript_35856/m.114828 type:complete len:233 (+) Transcript_35856:2119-2817(+)